MAGVTLNATINNPATTRQQPGNNPATTRQQPGNNPVNANIGAATATGTITDELGPGVTLSRTFLAVDEGTTITWTVGPHAWASPTGGGRQPSARVELSMTLFRARWITTASVPPASIAVRATKPASRSIGITASRTPSTKPSSCEVAAMSTLPTTTPTSSGRWSKDPIAWSKGNWSRKWLAYGPWPSSHTEIKLQVDVKQLLSFLTPEWNVRSSEPAMRVSKTAKGLEVRLR